MRDTIFPSFLNSNFALGDFQSVNIYKLYVGLRSKNKAKTKYVPVHKTPHYCFAKHHLYGNELYPVSGYQDYKHYINANSGTGSEEKYIQLIDSIKKRGYMWRTQPIFVFNHWTRLFPLGRLDVADGFHRLAILSALGEEEIKVVTLHQKYNIYRRSMHRLGRWFNGH